MKKIVLSGSMKLINHMEQYGEHLKEKGFEVVLPREDGWQALMTGDASAEDISAYKKYVSRRHFDAIADPDTDALLVANEPKNGVENYIGANTFAEIAIAFYFQKKIYLLHDYYEPFLDELRAWDAVVLGGDIEKLIRCEA